MTPKTTSFRDGVLISTFVALIASCNGMFRLSSKKGQDTSNAEKAVAFTLGTISDAKVGESVTISWTTDVAIQNFELTVGRSANDNECADPVVKIAEIKTTEQVFRPQDEGDFHVCVIGFLDDASSIAATNNGQKFHVESGIAPEVPPTNAEDETPTSGEHVFTLETPSNLRTATKTLTWNALASAESYEVYVTSQSDCSGQPIFSREIADATTITTTPIPDGDFFFCVDGELSDGTIVKAKNNGLEFNVKNWHLPYGVDNIATYDSSIYLSGSFSTAFAFNPDKPTQTIVPSGHSIFVAKHSLDSMFESVWIWENTGVSAWPGNAAFVSTDDTGNVFVAGLFSGTVDFDPTNGTDQIAATSATDTFITKMNADGTYGWTRTFAFGISDRSFHDIEADQDGYLHVIGVFTGTADFDPEAGVQNLSSVGYWDIFHLVISPQGSYHRAQTWGGGNTDGDWMGRLTVRGGIDSGGKILLANSFKNATVDLDLGAGTSEVTATGVNVAVWMIQMDGTFDWGSSFQGSSTYAMGLNIDESDNALISFLTFGGTIDLDPDPGVTDNRDSSNHGTLVASFDNFGTHRWSRFTSGLGTFLTGYGAPNTCHKGGCYVAGRLETSIDVDPTADTTQIDVQSGIRDIAVSKINADGSFGGYKMIIGEGDEDWVGAAVPTNVGLFVSGKLGGTADFAPFEDPNVRGTTGIETSFTSLLRDW